MGSPGNPRESKKPRETKKRPKRRKSRPRGSRGSQRGPKIEKSRKSCKIHGRVARFFENGNFDLSFFDCLGDVRSGLLGFRGEKSYNNKRTACGTHRFVREGKNKLENWFSKARLLRTLRLRITLEAQPLMFRRLIFTHWRGRYDTDPSQVPRGRTRFDIEKTRGFEDGRESFKNDTSQPPRLRTKIRGDAKGQKNAEGGVHFRRIRHEIQNRAPARPHARTKRNDSPVRRGAGSHSLPPTSDEYSG